MAGGKCGDSITMKLYSLRACCLALVLASTAESQAQNLTGTGHIDLKDGTWIAPNTFGKGFVWSPGNASLRFGIFEQEYLEIDSDLNPSIGYCSFAGGYNSVASGWGSIALGGVSYATGDFSLALAGGQARAEGSVGIAGRAEGYYSIAISGFASGEGSFALNQGQAFGNYATAFGSGSSAYGEWSFAIGPGTESRGYLSYAIGVGTKSGSVGGFAIGLSNLNKKKDGISDPNPAQESPDDPIFEIGAGTIYVEGKANALTVYRDGSVRLHKAHGGISMGAFQ